MYKITHRAIILIIIINVAKKANLGEEVKNEYMILHIDTYSTKLQFEI